MYDEFIPSQLQTKGYAVLKNIIDQDRIEHLIKTYSEVQQDSRFNIVFDVLNLSMLPFDHNMDETLMPFVRQIAQHTDISVNRLERGGLYFETTRGKFAWHVDHLSYYNWQTAYYYVNFWIPLIKPSGDKSGIQLIPQDALKEVLGDEKFQTQVYNQGAKRVVIENNTTRVFDDELNISHEWPFNLDQLAVTPSINVGDAIVYRGDVIHKTQDVEDSRLAISIRAVDQNLLFDKQRYFEQCFVKRMILEKNAYKTERVVNFINSKADQKIPLREIIENC